MPLEESVVLDLQQAFASIDELVSKLSAAAAQGAQAISDEVASAVGSSPVQVPVEVADPGALTDEIASATSGTQAIAVELGDPSALTDDIAGATQGQLFEITAELANPEEITAEAQAALDAASFTPQSDPNQPNNPNPVDPKVVEGLGGLERAALGAEAAGGLATGSFGGLQKALTSLSPEVKIAGGGLLAVGEVLHKMVEEGASAQQSIALFSDTFGAAGEKFKEFDLNGVNTSLEEMTLKLGSDDKAILGTVARLALLGRQTGATDDAIIHTAQQFTILAARAVTLNPSLGSVDDVMQRLPLALSRGGRFAQGFGINLTQAQLAAEALAEGITKPISEMSLYEKAALGATVATKTLGDHIGTDIDKGSQLGIFKLRAFKEEIRRALETQGLDLVGPITGAIAPIIPLFTNLAGIIGRVFFAIVPVVKPILESIFTPLAAGLHLVQSVVEPLIPVFHALGAVLEFTNKPIILLSDAANKLATLLHDSLAPAFDFVKETAAKALLPIIDIINKMIEAFNKIPFVGDIGKIPTDSLKRMADGAQTAGEKADDLAARNAVLGDGLQVVGDGATKAAEALDAYALAAIKGATAFGTGELFSNLATGVEAFNGSLLKSRGLVDQAYFAILKLGDKAPALIDFLALSFTKGGLSLEQFQETAIKSGLSLDELAAVEARVRDETDKFKSSVATAIGSVTDATKNLDDQGKAHIASFVAEIQKQAIDAAGFSNSITTLFARGFTELATDLLNAGPAVAGAAAEAAKASDPAVQAMQDNVHQAALLDTEAGASIDRYAAQAVVGFGKVGDAINGVVPDQTALSSDIDEALNAATNVLQDQQIATFQKAETLGENIPLGLAEGARRKSSELNTALDETIDGALLSAQARLEVGSPSRLFSREVGFPITEGIAEGIKAGAFNAEDAIGDVIHALQAKAESELSNVFDALHSGQALQDSQSRLGDVQQNRSDLLQKQGDLASRIKVLHALIRDEVANSAAITAREQQTIDRAAQNLASLQAQAADQAAVPGQLADAKRLLSLEGSDINDIRSRLAEATANALLGTGSQDLVKQLQSDLNDRQKAFDTAQKNVDDLTSKMDDQKVSAVDLQVAQEDLTKAQQDAVGPTQQLSDLQSQLKQAMDDQVQVGKDLTQSTKDIATAQLGLLEAYSRAAKAGDTFFAQGDKGQDTLRALGRAAGFGAEQIQALIDKYANFSVLISQTVGGAGAANTNPLTGGGIDVFGNGSVFAKSPQEATDILNFIRGNAGQDALSPQQTAALPWNINIYQASDPAAVAFAVASQVGLQGVR